MCSAWMRSSSALAGGRGSGVISRTTVSTWNSTTPTLSGPSPAHYLSAMLLDLQLDGPPERAAGRARELVAAGAAGLFTFEGPHDVFLPLAAAAASGVETELMTNVAIAMPRSPMHLAHTAHDLQRMSGGRFRLGLGSQVRPHIENRYGATWSPPAARMREIVLAVKAILGAWQDGTRLDFRGEHTRHTLMPPTFVPGPLA